MGAAERTLGAAVGTRSRALRARAMPAAEGDPPPRSSDAGRNREVSANPVERRERSAPGISFQLGMVGGSSLDVVSPAEPSPVSSPSPPGSSGSECREEARGLNDKTKTPPAKIVKHPRSTQVGVGGEVANSWPQVSRTRARGRPSRPLARGSSAVAAEGSGRQGGDPPASRSGSS